MPQSPLPTSARIECFRTGSFTSMEGVPLAYTSADLKAIAESYDPETAPVPVVIGHPTADAPAYAWADFFDYDEKAGKLGATLKDIEPSFAAAVRAGRYRKVSLSLFPPHHPANPTPGSWYPRHIGFLGAASPAVTGLKNVSFAIGSQDTVTFEGEFASFGDPGYEQTASIFRRIRDFFIAEHGLEKADQVLPAYEIEWLGEIETPRTPPPADLLPSYATDGLVPPVPAAKPTPKPAEEAPVPGTETADFATREASLNERERQLAERDRAVVHTDNVSFAARMVEEGRLLPALKDKVIAIMDALPGHASVSFAAGEEAISPGAALRQVLEAQPVIVSFGRQDLGQGPGDVTAASFAADGKEVDPGDLALHVKAEAYMRDHPDTPYLDAVKAVS